MVEPLAVRFKVGGARQFGAQGQGLGPSCLARQRDSVLTDGALRADNTMPAAISTKAAA